MGSKLGQRITKEGAMLGGKNTGLGAYCSPVTLACPPPLSRSLLVGRFCGPLRQVWMLGQAGREEETLPTCMVTLAISTGTQCRFSSPQQPVQRSRETQDGLNICSTSLGYSDMMSTSRSSVRQ